MKKAIADRVPIPQGLRRFFKRYSFRAAHRAAARQPPREPVRPTENMMYCDVVETQPAAIRSVDTAEQSPPQSQQSPVPTGEKPGDHRLVAESGIASVRARFTPSLDSEREQVALAGRSRQVDPRAHEEQTPRSTDPRNAGETHNTSAINDTENSRSATTRAGLRRFSPIGESDPATASPSIISLPRMSAEHFRSHLVSLENLGHATDALSEVADAIPLVGPVLAKTLKGVRALFDLGIEFAEQQERLEASAQRCRIALHDIVRARQRDLIMGNSYDTQISAVITIQVLCNHALDWFDALKAHSDGARLAKYRGVVKIFLDSFDSELREAERRLDRELSIAIMSELARLRRDNRTSRAEMKDHISTEISSLSDGMKELFLRCFEEYHSSGRVEEEIISLKRRETALAGDDVNMEQGGAIEELSQIGSEMLSSFADTEDIELPMPRTVAFDALQGAREMAICHLNGWELVQAIRILKLERVPLISPIEEIIGDFDIVTLNRFRVAIPAFIKSAKGRAVATLNP